MPARSTLGSGSLPTFRARALIAGVTVLVTAAASAAPRSSRVAVNVAESTRDRVVLEYRFGAFDRLAVDVHGAAHTLISYPREAPLLKAGAPDLPHVTRSVIIPDLGDVALKVVDAKYYEITQLDIAPSKGNLSRAIDPATVPYSFDETIYRTDGFYPGELALLHEPYILRDHRGVVVDVFPFQYNPVTRTLRVYTKMTVAVVPSASIGANELWARPHRAASRAFEQLYEAHFINYQPTLRYTPLDETGGMLIICYDSWLTNVQPLVTYKNSIGISTTAVGVTTIGNNATAIKNYIQTQYNQGDLAFVLLVGDSGQVATPIVSTSQGSGAGDPTYAKVAGGDNYPDIFIGRFSAESAADVNTQVLRSVEYETLLATQQAWYHKGVGIASSQGAGIGDDGEADYVHIGNIRTQLLANGYTVVDEIYDTNGGTAAMVSTALNAGRGIINYCGHGSDTSWGSTGFSNSNVNALVNDNLLPFIFSVACVNGNFTRTGGPCFAEAWLRATHNGEPIGAAATYMSSVNQSWAPPMEAEDAFDTLLVNQTYHSFGALCYGGSCSMMDKYGAGTGGDGTEMFDTWHVFGDPSLRVIGVAAPPHGMDVTPPDGLSSEGPHGGPFAPGSIDYTLKNKGSSPIGYSVAKLANWISLSSPSGTIPGLGQVVVTVSINSSANTLVNGQYADTIQIVNTTDHDGDTTRSVALKVGAPTLIYSWNLDANPGWTTTGQWAFGQPTGGGSHSHDPNRGYTGTNVYGYNLSGDYASNIASPYYLTTTAIDCTYLTQVKLKFWRWLGVETSTYDHASVDVSGNGQNWTGVWQNSTSNISDAAWSQQIFDISAVADSHAMVYVRWGMGLTDTGVTYPGWNIDDVEIWALDGTPPPPDGACCQTDGSCSVTTQAACTGAWQGAGTSCNPNPCPQPQGACCQPNRSCGVTTETACTGTWQGAGTTCSPNPCRSAVCRGDANCDGAVSWRDIDYFVAAMNNNQSAWAAKFLPAAPTCAFENCEVNGDGVVSWRDISSFVAIMNTTCPP